MEGKTIKYVVGYVRSAIKDPTEEAINRQEQHIQQYCNENNLVLLNTFKDNGANGNNINRPGWTELMGFINQNKGIVQSIIVAGLDRIARDFIIYCLEEKNLRENYRITIQSAIYAQNKLIDALLKNLSTRKDRARKRQGRKKM